MSKGSIRRNKRRDSRREDKEAQALLISVGAEYYGSLGLKNIEAAKKWLKFAKTPPTAFGDMDIYGRAIPFNYGAFRHTCPIIWTTKLTPITEQPNENFAEQYRASFAARICEGPQGSLLRVWFNKVLVFDRTTPSGDGYSSAPDFSNKISFYPGNTTQTADPVIVAVEGTGNVPAYRDTCYIVCKDIPMGRFNNALPEIEAEVVGVATPDYTTYDVTGFTAPATANIQQFYVSRTSPFVYQYDDGNLYVIRKHIALVRRTIDVQAALDAIAAGCSVKGRFTVEEQGSGALETLYFLCEDSANKAFVARYDGQSWANNYDNRVTGAAFDTSFIHNGRLFIADGTAGKIYCYNKNSLVLQWSRSTPLAGVEAGNFTYDNAGNVWTVWYDAGDPDSIYLSRCSSGGTVHHYTIAEESSCAARGIMFDYDSNSLVVGGVTGHSLTKLALSSAGVPSFFDSTSNRTYDNNVPLFVSQHRFSRTFYATNNTNLYKMKASGFLLTSETIALSNFADTGTGNEAYAYDFLGRAVWICRDASPGMSKLPLNRDSSATADLDDVLSSLCTESGLVAGDIDVTEATAHPVAGYTIQDQTTAQDPLTQLMTAYQFGVREHFESGYSQIKLEFVDRGVAPGTITTIEEDEVGMGEGAPEDPTFGEELIEEESLPRLVKVRYADTRRNYSAHNQTSDVPDDVTSATEELTLEFPNLVMTDDEAKQLADKVLSAGWSEDKRKFFSVPLWYLEIEPEDTLEIELDGESHLLRVEEVELGENYLLEISAVHAFSDLFTSASTGDESDANDQTPEVLTPSALILVDCPAVRDVDGALTDAGFYLFAAPQTEDEDWPGCRVWRSLDGQFSPPLTTITGAATWGTTTDVLGDGDHYVFDEDSEVTVQLLGGTLSTQTSAALSEDRLLNLAAIGSESGGWELVQFATVTDNGNDSYTLTGMRRGRFGTEQYTATHTAGETFVLFDFTTPTTQRIPLGLYDRGQERYYKAVTVGSSQSGVAGRAFTNQARSLMPYFPVNVVGVLASGDWTINFRRRTRIGGDLFDYDDVALNELTEEYEIDIRESINDPVLRTLTIGPGLPTNSAGNLSVDAATQKFIRAAGNWQTDGFLVGQRVESSGFSNAGNNGRWTISVLTATDMTVTEGETTLVTEAAAAGRVMTAVSPAVQYTAAQQTADGGSKSSFYAEVYQISDTLRAQDGIGRGFTVQVLIS